MSEKEEEAVSHNLQFALAEASELTTFLASLNCSSVFDNEHEPDWEELDKEVRKINEGLKLLNDDWMVFRENYAVLKEKYDNGN